MLNNKYKMSQINSQENVSSVFQKVEQLVKILSVPGGDKKYGSSTIHL